MNYESNLLLDGEQTKDDITTWCNGLREGPGAAGLEAAERLDNSSYLVAILRHNTYLTSSKASGSLLKSLTPGDLAESPRHAPVLAESSEYIKQVLELMPDVVGAEIEHAIAAVAIPLFARVTGTTGLLDVAESAAIEALPSPEFIHNSQSAVWQLAKAQSVD